MLLVFCETNELNISKQELYIYTKQDISGTTQLWVTKKIKR